MSVGGSVIHVCRVRKKLDGVVRHVKSVWTCDSHGTECAVYVDDACPVEAGDKLWWQGRNAYWTKDGGKEDVPFVRYGYSFDPTQETRL